MDFRNVYIDLCMGDDSEEKPLILEQVLFCPALFWVCQELLARGAQRFFIVCDESWKADVERAVSDIAGAEVFTDADAARAAAGACVTLTGAVLPIEGDAMPFGGGITLPRCGVPKASCPRRDHHRSRHHLHRSPRQDRSRDGGDAQHHRAGKERGGGTL